MTSSTEARYYRVLELPAGSALTEAQLRQAYHRRALQLHPDRHLREGGAHSSTAAAAAEGFKELQVAYEYLQKKVRQQEQLEQYRKKRQSAGANGATGGGGGGGGGPMDDIHSLFDAYRRGPYGQPKSGKQQTKRTTTTTTTTMTEAELFKDTVPGGWVYREGGAGRAGARRGPAAGGTSPQRQSSNSGGGGRNKEAEARWRQAHGARVPERAYSGPVYDDAFYRKYARADDTAAEAHTPPSFKYADKYKERVQRGSREYDAAAAGQSGGGPNAETTEAPEAREETTEETPPFMNTAAAIDKINSLPDGDDRRAALQKEWTRLRANIDKKMHQQDHAPPPPASADPPSAAGPHVGTAAATAAAPRAAPRKTSKGEAEADDTSQQKATPTPETEAAQPPQTEGRRAVSDEEWLRQRTEQVRQQMEAESSDNNNSSSRGGEGPHRPPPPPAQESRAERGAPASTLPPPEADPRGAAAAQQQDELLRERRQLYRYSLAEQYLPPPEALQQLGDGELAVLSLLLTEWGGRVEEMLGRRLRSGVRRCACCGRRRQQGAAQTSGARTINLTSPSSSSSEEEDETVLDVFQCAHSLCVCPVCAHLAQCCPLCGAPRRLGGGADVHPDV